MSSIISVALGSASPKFRSELQFPQCDKQKKLWVALHMPRLQLDVQNSTLCHASYQFSYSSLQRLMTILGYKHYVLRCEQRRRTWLKLQCKQWASMFWKIVIRHENVCPGSLHNSWQTRLTSQGQADYHRHNLWIIAKTQGPRWKE